MHIFFTEIRCQSLPTIDNGNIAYSNDDTIDFSLGTVAIHSCDFGYSLTDENQNRTCQQDNQADTLGEWSESQPLCRRKIAGVVYW